ncbi:hypothetical protein ED733_002454 [Metarhizium rileyi]|uniref:Uncharacterized protein n=1 Tax=Metarhizium rileyi (strain RCEF 4871) TaxID=1649241 RepID=A0A5C6G5P3_METRR|nr:hypothetical protein ED733_002454 [Metarhizium rileyi]
MVLGVSEAIVVKFVRAMDNITDYTSMQYLQDHMPRIPAPRLHGLVTLSKFYLIFMSFMPARRYTLGFRVSALPGESAAWWDIRVGPELIMTPREFEESIFSKPRFGSPVYINFLKTFSTSDQTVSNCALPHGEIRPANIKVEQKRRWNLLRSQMTFLEY